ncbi:MAG: hypothetical protein JJU36_02465 [Phycisphaeraceae bacterium]|nr:hypothetical protein [Phycisphaeraceae bacterium]
MTKKRSAKKKPIRKAKAEKVNILLRLDRSLVERIDALAAEIDLSRNSYIARVLQDTTGMVNALDSEGGMMEHFQQSMEHLLVQAMKAASDEVRKSSDKG